MPSDLEESRVSSVDNDDNVDDVVDDVEDDDGAQHNDENDHGNKRKRIDISKYLTASILLFLTRC